MKKGILFLILFLSFFNGFTQSFTIPNDTVKVATATSSNMYNNITNISGSTIAIDWKVVVHDFPPDWQSSFAICDNILCYYNSNGSLMGPMGNGGQTHTTDTFGAGKTANFYVLPDVSTGVPGTHYLQVDMSEGTYTKSSWYIVSKWPTGVVSVSQSVNEFEVFPNPATSELTVLHGKAANIERLQLYNISGAKVAEYNAKEIATKLDITSFTPGLYFIKLIDKNGHLAGTLKVDHQ